MKNFTVYKFHIIFLIQRTLIHVHVFNFTINFSAPQWNTQYLVKIQQISGSSWNRRIYWISEITINILLRSNVQLNIFIPPVDLISQYMTNLFELKKHSPVLTMGNPAKYETCYQQRRVSISLLKNVNFITLR